jgi:hypothetical protein
MPKAIDMGDGREVRKGATGKPLLATSRPNKFDEEKRKAFLTQLSGCCNVRASAEAAGCSVGAVNYWRGADPEFAEAVELAREAGYIQIEQMLMERAMGGHNPNKLGLEDYEQAPDPAQMDTELALRLLSLHHRQVKGGRPQGGGAARRKATREETDAAILKALEVMQIRFEHGED